MGKVFFYIWNICRESAILTVETKIAFIEVMVFRRPFLLSPLSRRLSILAFVFHWTYLNVPFLRIDMSWSIRLQLSSFPLNFDDSSLGAIQKYVTLFGRDLQHGRLAAKNNDMSQRVGYTTRRISHIHCIRLNTKCRISWIYCLRGRGGSHTFAFRFP